MHFRWSSELQMLLRRGNTDRLFEGRTGSLNLREPEQRNTANAIQLIIYNAVIANNNEFLNLMPLINRNPVECPISTDITKTPS